MTDHARAIEAGARAKSIVTDEMVLAASDAYFSKPPETSFLDVLRCAIEAAIASGELVPASAGKPFDKIKAGLEEAVSIAKGEQPATRIYVQGHEYVPASATKPYSSAEFLTSPEALDEYVASAVAAERERCAQAAEGNSPSFNMSQALNECRDSEAGFHNGRIAAAKTIRALSPEPASGEFVWRDISTAPKDGTWILGWAERDSSPYRISWGVNHNGTETWCTSFSSFCANYITHWMPLPTLLNAATKDGEPA